MLIDMYKNELLFLYFLTYSSLIHFRWIRVRFETWIPLYYIFVILDSYTVDSRYLDFGYLE